MNEKSARSLYEQKISQQIQSLLPNGAGSITEIRLRHALDQVAQVAFSAGGSYALLSLLTVDDVADQLSVSVRRVRAIAKIKHEQFGIGFQVPNTAQWLFRPSEIESLRPGVVGRPAKTQPTQVAADGDNVAHQLLGGLPAKGVSC
jgi:hypothetical protein